MSEAAATDAAERVVDVKRWREICVGFTDGVIAWPDSRASMDVVWKGIPDLEFDAQHLVSARRRARAVIAV